MWDYSVWYRGPSGRPYPGRNKGVNGHSYRWKYGGFLKLGFKMLQTHDYERPIRHKAFRRGWLDRVELAATGSNYDFRLTGPFARFCLCHSLFLDGLTCIVTDRVVSRWTVADAKSRVLCEATLKDGLVYVPDEVVYLWAPT